MQVMHPRTGGTASLAFQMPVKRIQALVDIVGDGRRVVVFEADVVGLLHAWFSLYGRNDHVPSIGSLCRVAINAFHLVPGPATPTVRLTRHNPELGIRPVKGRLCNGRRSMVRDAVHRGSRTSQVIAMRLVYTR